MFVIFWLQCYLYCVCSVTEEDTFACTIISRTRQSHRAPRLLLRNSCSLLFALSGSTASVTHRILINYETILMLFLYLQKRKTMELRKTNTVKWSSPRLWLVHEWRLDEVRKRAVISYGVLTVASWAGLAESNCIIDSICNKSQFKNKRYFLLYFILNIIGIRNTVNKLFTI